MASTRVHPDCLLSLLPIYRRWTSFTVPDVNYHLQSRNWIQLECVCLYWPLCGTLGLTLRLFVLVWILCRAVLQSGSTVFVRFHCPVSYLLVWISCGSQSILAAWLSQQQAIFILDLATVISVASTYTQGEGLSWLLFLLLLLPWV